jgi:hypothetical protein
MDAVLMEPTLEKTTDVLGAQADGAVSGSKGSVPNIRGPNTGLPSALRVGCAKVMLQADWSVLPFGMSNITGANLVWMATSRVYRGLLLNNATEVHVATNRIFAELYTTTGPGPGVKEDGSYFQHCNPHTKGGIQIGPFGQLYNGGYGAGFTQYMVDWCKLLVLPF